MKIKRMKTIKDLAVIVKTATLLFFFCFSTFFQGAIYAQPEGFFKYPIQDKSEEKTVSDEEDKRGVGSVYQTEMKTLSIKSTKEQIFLDQGKAIVIRIPEPVVRAAVANPDIADIVVLNSDEIMINARSQGATNLIIWYDTGVFNNYDLLVGVDHSKLEETINHIIDGSGNVRVFDSNDSIVLKGNVKDVSTYDKVEKIAQAYMGGGDAGNIVNFVEIEQNEQILLEVRFIEVNLTLSKKFGFDMLTLFDNFAGYSFVGQTQETLNSDSTTTLKNGRISADLFGASSNEQYNAVWSAGSVAINTVIDDLKTQGVLKVIANPNLVAQNNEEASFLVGGEFPVVSVSDTNLNTEYKDFGIKLNFVPTITERGTIRLKIAPEVSQLDFTTAAVTVNNALIPALKTRKTETTVELRDAKSLVISGLLSKTENNSRGTSSPLSRLPFLGNLFSTHSVVGEEVDLLVIVTPHIVNPMDFGQEKEFYNEDEVKKIINMSHLDIPMEQANEMKKLLTQYDKLPKEESIDLVNQTVKQRIDDEVADKELKAVEEAMIDFLEEQEKLKEKEERLEKKRERDEARKAKRQVVVQTTEEVAYDSTRKQKEMQAALQEIDPEEEAKRKRAEEKKKLAAEKAKKREEVKQKRLELKKKKAEEKKRLAAEKAKKREEAKQKKLELKKKRAEEKKKLAAEKAKKREEANQKKLELKQKEAEEKKKIAEQKAQEEKMRKIAEEEKKRIAAEKKKAERSIKVSDIKEEGVLLEEKVAVTSLKEQALSKKQINSQISAFDQEIADKKLQANQYYRNGEAVKGKEIMDQIFELRRKRDLLKEKL